MCVRIYIYIYIYICVCVCVCICLHICMCLSMISIISNWIILFTFMKTMNFFSTLPSYLIYKWHFTMFGWVCFVCISDKAQWLLSQFCTKTKDSIRSNSFYIWIFQVLEIDSRVWSMLNKIGPLFKWVHFFCFFCFFNKTYLKSW